MSEPKKTSAWRISLCVGGGILVAFIVLLAASLAPDRPVDSLRARWGGAPSQFVNLAGMTVHLRDEGPRDDAQPIVLLHGTSASLHTWDGWAADLSKTRRVIRVDLPGFGLTGPAPDHDYHITAYVRFVRALYDHFGLSHSVLAGNSLGGAIAWESALAMRSRVDKLILVDAAGYPMTATEIPLGFRLARIESLAPLLDRVLPRGMIERSLASVYGDPAKVSPALVDRYYELTLRAGNRAALGERFRQTVWGEGSERITGIAQPTLILWGERDHLIPPDHAARFAHDIAHNTLVTFPALGHVPQEEDPAATLGPVHDFLVAPDGPGGAGAAPAH